MRKLIRKSNRGFTLLETLVALSIFSMSILAIMSVLGSGISDISYAKKKMTAAYLAQEGIEYVRNRRDTLALFEPGQSGWSQFKNEVRSLSENENYHPAPSGFSEFTRKISAEVGNDEVKIYSKVEWSQGSGDYSITFSENLFDWIEQ